MDEAYIMKLRELFEKYGYTRYKMGMFEPYELYAENKEFLRSEGIITFTGASGKLMALKPDVTMSIIKHAGSLTGTQKYYYNENVFRLEFAGEEYREISQMGIEYIGGDSRYAESETVLLAKLTLEIISPQHTLEINHMGLLLGILRKIGVGKENEDYFISLIRSKNQGGIREKAREIGLSKSAADELLTLAMFREDLSSALLKLSGWGCEEELAELQNLQNSLDALGKLDSVYLDFSVINDLDYYNALVFRGYIQSAPRAVIAGGRYDNLLSRMGQRRTAVGFAVYLGALDRVLTKKKVYDVDVLLIYGKAAPAEVSMAVSKLIANGRSVRALESDPGNVRARQILSLEEF